MSAPTSRGWIAAAAPIGALCAAVLLGTRGMSERGDEGSHYPQIRDLLAGSWAVRDDLTMIPGYHAVVAALSALVGASELEPVRLVSLGLSLLTLVAYGSLARRTAPDDAPLRVLQLFLLPILCPYLFLLYTDSFAFLPLLVSLALALRGRLALAGLVGLVGLLTRQTHIVWLAWIVLVAWERRGEPLRPGPFLRHALAAWPFVLAAVAFVAFVIWNGGVALGMQDVLHVGVHLTNVWFGLAVFPVLLLPLVLARMPTVLAQLGDPRTWAGLGALALLYVGTWGVHHGANTNVAGFVHNHIAVWGDSGPLQRAVFFVPIALSALLLRAWPLRQTPAALLGAFWVFSVLPLEMIEFRYHLVALSLFLLFRPSERRPVEWATCGWFLLLSGALLVGIEDGHVFP